MKIHIVIGSSAAAIGALSRIRALDKESKVICITASKEMPYNTCLLADFLSGSRDEQSIVTKDEQFFVDNGIELHLDTIVTQISPNDHRIETSKGDFSYDTLFLGLGTSISLPSIKGIETLEEVYKFHTLADTNKLMTKIKQKSIKSAIIIGAGLSGVECSDSLVEHGIKVHLVEKDSSLLPRQIDQEGSKIIENLMPSNGVTFHKNVTVEEINGSNNSCKLSSGKTISGDVIIFTTGGRPNTELAASAGINVNGGVVVDEFMRTNFENIYAGGDIACVPDLLMGSKSRSTMWPDAMTQGMHAGFAMAGSPRPYKGMLAIGSSNFYGITFVSCGPIVNTPENYEAITITNDQFHHKFLVEGSSLKGFLMVGAVDNLGALRRLILTKEPVDREILSKLMGYTI